jgi:hypothetical protein
MGRHPLTAAQLAETLAASREFGSRTEAAEWLGLSLDAYLTRLKKARRADKAHAGGHLSGGFVRSTATPSPHVPLPEQIARLCADYARKREHADATKLVRLRITMRGPLGMIIFGDQHAGSPLTNWPALTRDIELVKNTEGLFATNIGDVADNWTGRLAHLWADNEMSKTTEGRLSRWIVEELADKWLLLLYGNHDLWSGEGSALQWLCEQHDVLDANWSQRVALDFPNGREVRIGAYHGANGHSMWNAVHGGIKLAKMGPRDHLIVAGHTHKAQVLYPIVDPDSGDWATVLNVGSYKDLSDNYGKRLGGGEQNAFPSALVVINPDARTPAGLLQVFTDTEEGAAYLTWLRGRV